MTRLTIKSNVKNTVNTPFASARASDLEDSSWLSLMSFKVLTIGQNMSCVRSKPSNCNNHHVRHILRSYERCSDSSISDWICPCSKFCFFTENSTLWVHFLMVSIIIRTVWVVQVSATTYFLAAPGSSAHLAYLGVLWACCIFLVVSHFSLLK